MTHLILKNRSSNYDIRIIVQEKQFAADNFSDKRQYNIPYACTSPLYFNKKIFKVKIAVHEISNLMKALDKD